IVTQAAARGERVLLLSPTAAALDRVLEFAGRREVLCPIRCIGRDERAETLADWVRPFTFEERVRGLRETAVKAARTDAPAARERVEADRAKLRAREEELGKEGRQLQQEIDADRPIVEARQGGRWWAPAWWRGLFRRDLVVRHGERMARLQVIGQEEALLKGKT